jgi:hypothetical protein
MKLFDGYHECCLILDLWPMYVDGSMEGALTRFVQVITAWPSLASLLVLVVNDCYLKFTYANVVTGKLSDFSGILLVALLLFGTFPRLRHHLAAAIILCFAVWKSPLADEFILFVQSLGFGWFGRVVDYTDLAAFMMIPFAYRFTSFRSDEHGVISPFVRRYLAAPLLLIVFLAVTGTSYIPYLNEYSIR